MHHKNEITKIIQEATAGHGLDINIKRIHQLMDDYAEDQNSLPSDEEIREPIQNALYATGNLLTDECTELAVGILDYLHDAGFEFVKK